MSNRIITPTEAVGPFSAMKAKLDSMTESFHDVYLRNINELVDDSLKDLNGGCLPTEKAKRKHLKGIRHSDGLMFYWRNRPMLFVSNPMFQRGENGNVEMSVVDKRVYKDEPQEPVKASN